MAVCAAGFCSVFSSSLLFKQQGFFQSEKEDGLMSALETLELLLPAPVLCHITRYNILHVLCMYRASCMHAG